MPRGSLSQDFFGEPPKEMPKVLLGAARSVEQEDCNAIRRSVPFLFASSVPSLYALHSRPKDSGSEK